MKCLALLGGSSRHAWWGRQTVQLSVGRWGDTRTDTRHFVCRKRRPRLRAQRNERRRPVAVVRNLLIGFQKRSNLDLSKFFSVFAHRFKCLWSLLPHTLDLLSVSVASFKSNHTTCHGVDNPYMRRRNAPFTRFKGQWKYLCSDSFVE